MVTGPSPDYMDYALHVSPTRRYIYVVNPKVACSSTIWTLRRLELGAPDLMPERVGVIHDRTGSPLLTWREAQALPDFDPAEYLVFTFSRNPYDRILSCYLNKVARPTRYRTELQGLLGLGPDADISFDTFVDLVGRQDPAAMDPHWRPQTIVTMQDHLRFDSIGRFERFDADLLAVGRRLDPEFGRYVYAEKRQATGAKPYDLLTPPIVDIINRVYDQDFKRFGYSRTLPSGAVANVPSYSAA